MRYIDADALDCLIWSDGEHGTTFDDGVSWILEKIDKLPSVEPPIKQKCCVCPHCNNCDVNDDGTITQKGTDADTVSRKAAIDEIKALYEWHDTVTEDRTINHLKRLPSAQPEIIRCKDCMYFDKGWCGYLDTTMGMSDFCSRAKRRTDGV